MIEDLILQALGVLSGVVLGTLILLLLIKMRWWPYNDL